MLDSSHRWCDIGIVACKPYFSKHDCVVLKQLELLKQKYFLEKSLLSKTKRVPGNNGIMAFWLVTFFR